MNDSAAEVAIRVDDVWASFRDYRDQAATLRERLVGRKTKYDERWALEGVTLDIHRGETVGIIGPNGSGKSTLLKLMARIFKPTKGSITVDGVVAPMLELGAGFHAELSGRENVYLNAALLGHSAAKVDGIFDAIVDFAELADSIEQPVRTYSSGMYLRLGFSVAVHLEPDVLLVDEVLAVGDARFRRRCLERIDELRRNGATIVVVSHDLNTIGKLCDRVIFMEKGKVRMSGTPAEVVPVYRQATGGPPAKKGWDGGAVRTTGHVQIDGCTVLDADSRAVESIAAGQRIHVVVAATFKRAVEDPVFGMILRNSDGVQIHDTNTLWQGKQTGAHDAGERVEARFTFEARLHPGRYSLTVAVARADGRQIHCWNTNAVSFTVAGDQTDKGLVPLGAQISVARAESREQRDLSTYVPESSGPSAAVSARAGGA